MSAMKPGGIHRSWLRGTALGIIALLASASLHADYTPLAGQIGVTVASLQAQVVRKSRCAANVSVYEARIAKLELNPVKNAKAITNTEALLAAARECVTDAGEQIVTLGTQLTTQSGKFVDGTGADATDLQQRVSTLKAEELDRARLAARLRKAQTQLRRLQQATNPDPVLIAQKTAVVNTLRAELDEAVAVVSLSNQQLVAWETDLLSANHTGSASLTWSTPSTRADGSPLATGEIGGYEIYVVSEANGTNTVITLVDPLATSYTVEGLVPDTYHFSIAAFDTSGALSELSTVVSKTVE